MLLVGVQVKVDFECEEATFLSVRERDFTILERGGQRFRTFEDVFVFLFTSRFFLIVIFLNHLLFFGVLNKLTMHGRKMNNLNL